MDNNKKVLKEVEKHYGFIRVPIKADISTVFQQICLQLIQDGILFIDIEKMYNEIEYTWMIEGVKLCQTK